MKIPFLPVHIIRTSRLKKVKDDAFAEARSSNKKLVCDLLSANVKLTDDVKELAGGKLPSLKRGNRRRKSHLKVG